MSLWTLERDLARLAKAMSAVSRPKPKKRRPPHLPATPPRKKRLSKPSGAPTASRPSSSSGPAMSEAPTRFGRGLCPGCERRNETLFNTADGPRCRDCLVGPEARPAPSSGQKESES